MKKAYTPPKLYYESFQLAQNISAGCEGIANFNDICCSIDVNDIGVTLNIYAQPGIFVFTGPGFEDRICYHAPTEMNNAFSS